MANAWQQFFDSHAPYYDQNPFTQNTVAEVDFFLSLFPLSAGASILDMGCGTGRHAAELAKRGYQVTGVDISDGMLGEARKKAETMGVSVRWVQADATQRLDLHSPISASLPTKGDRFDAAISLCEGGFGLIGQGEDAEAHDRAILDNIANHLKPNAPFLLTTLNGYQVIRQMKDEFIEAGRFDPATMVSNYEDQWDLPEGPRVVKIRERLFIPPEMVKILRESGFRCDRVFGGTAGNWGQRPLSLDEIEAMYVCRKVG
ncbi:MAG: methyltransferase domain-containing protein [Fimbriimonadaceae bacterium]|nr:methyltransferase domain-containing protein [Fimbriimonadaceae bacterium]